MALNPMGVRIDFTSKPTRTSDRSGADVAATTAAAVAPATTTPARVQTHQRRYHGVGVAAAVGCVDGSEVSANR
jgi:ElaB/YqjD/DUF883 family membrane-anchored ribosome-binding protein